MWGQVLRLFWLITGLTSQNFSDINMISLARDYECVKWRQTSDCVPTGPRQPHLDQPCHRIVRSGASGYCELRHKLTGSIIRVFESQCGHEDFSCDVFSFRKRMLGVLQHLNQLGRCTGRVGRGIVMMIADRIALDTYTAVILALSFKYSLNSLPKLSLSTQSIAHALPHPFHPRCVFSVSMAATSRLKFSLSQASSPFPTRTSKPSMH